MRKVLILLALCAFTSAMVPRENHPATATATAAASSSTSGNSSKTYCQPYTPCAWSIYKPVTKQVLSFVTNSYCICSPDTECLIASDDKQASAYEYRCRPPGTETDIDIGTR